MTTVDVFVMLTLPGSRATVHNVRLVDAMPGDDGFTRLVVEHSGVTRELVSADRWNENFSRRDIGRFGYLMASRVLREAPRGGCCFYAYMDPTLRRVPELDSVGHSEDANGRAAIGWCCDSKPGGFWAPVGLIPGEGGRFVPDDTIEVSVRVPPEFVRECRRVQMGPEDVLRSFVADLAGVQNFIACPRADGLSSNGSDERDYAEAWLERAHGMNAIDLDAADQREWEHQEEEARREDFAALLDDFQAHGGAPEDLIAAVEALVEKQARASEGPGT